MADEDVKIVIKQKGTIPVYTKTKVGVAEVHHDETLKGSGTTSAPLGISDEVMEEIENAGKVDDVRVDGVSVVADKIAEIDLTGKVDKTSEADKVYGTDSEGNQTIYDVNSFGKIDNIEIHGVTQPNVNKTVDLSVIEQMTELPAPSSTYDGRVVQYIGKNTQTLTHNCFYECTSRIVYTDATRIVRAASPQLVASANIETFLQSGLDTNTPYLYERHGAYWDCIDPAGVTILGPAAGLVAGGIVNPKDQVILEVDSEQVNKWVAINVQSYVGVEDVLVNGTSVVTNGVANVTVPTKTSDITNDSGFITKDVNDLTNYTKTEDLADVALSGDYDDLINAPTNVSEFTNDANYQNAQEVQDAIDVATANMVEEGDNVSVLNNDANYQNATQVSNTVSGAINTHNTSNDAHSNLLTPITEDISDLHDQIDNLSGRGRFLALWNCATGLAESNPPESPYPYKAGDYFVVGTVSSADPAVNYKPDGSSYTTGVASTTVETNEVSVNDTYFYDGTVWKLQSNAQKEVLFSALAGSPYDNTNLSNALNSKQDTLTAGTNITIDANNVISSTSYESLFKGKYNTWSDVPTVGANYPLYIDDGTHTHEPTYTDYMIVVDASTVPGGQVPIVITFKISAYYQRGSVKTNIDGTEYNGYGSFDGKVQVRTDVSTGNYGTQFVVLSEDIEYQGHTYHQGEVFLEIIHNRVIYGQEYTYNAQLSLGYPYKGTWRFSYRGVWATDNRSGWVGEYPIEQELPIATDTDAGIAKLYNTTGQNTDGSMTQKSITDALNAKANIADLATVATSGSYNDLSDKPTIPTVNNATLTIQKNGTTVQTFTANQSTNATANISVPTKTSDITNDSGFITSASVATLTDVELTSLADGNALVYDADTGKWVNGTGGVSATYDATTKTITFA